MKYSPWPYGRQPEGAETFRAECLLAIRRYTEILEFTALTNFGVNVRMSICIEDWSPGQWIELLQLSSCCSESLTMNRSATQADDYWYCSACALPHPRNSARAELYLDFAPGTGLEDHLPAIDRGRAIYEAFAREHMDPIQAIVVVEELLAILKHAALGDHSVRDAPLRHTDLIPLDGMNPQ